MLLNVTWLSTCDKNRIEIEIWTYNELMIPLQFSMSAVPPWYIYQFTIIIISGIIWIRRRLRDSEYTGLHLIGGTIILVVPWSYYLTLPLSFLLTWLFSIFNIHPPLHIVVPMFVVFGLWITLPFIIDEIRRSREVHDVSGLFEESEERSHWLTPQFLKQ